MCSTGLVGTEPAGILLSRERICIFPTPVTTSQRLGELLVQGRVPAGAELQYLKGKAFRWWRCGTRQRTATEALCPGTALKHVAAPGLCAHGFVLLDNPRVRNILSGSQAVQCAGWLDAWGRQSPIYPLTGASFSKRLCGGVRLCGEAAFLEAEMFLYALAFLPFRQRASCQGRLPRPPTPDWLPSGLSPTVISHCQYKPEVTNNSQCVKKGTFLAARTAVAGDHRPVKNSN